MRFTILALIRTALLLCLAAAVACTPAKLDEAKVTGQDSSMGSSDAGAIGGDATADAATDAATDAAEVADANAEIDGGSATDGSFGDATGACLSPADCPKPEPCQKATCTAGKCGVEFLSTGKCDDDEPCTLGDNCQAGACKPGSGWDMVACACHPDPSYARSCPDDGNLCNGQQFCTKTATGYICKTGAVPDPCEDSDPEDCLTSGCDPKTGLCVKSNVKKGTACSAGFPAAWTCVANQSCDGQGKCELQNTCECANDTDCVAKDDGNVCNGKLFCNKDPKATGPKCQINPKTVVSCAASNNTTCLKNACNKATGKCAMAPTENVKEECDSKTTQCWWVPLEPSETKKALVNCDDGLGCTLNDECVAGKCIGTTDACICTTDAECQSSEAWSAFKDLCRGKPYCDKSNSAAPVCKLNPATVPQCSAGLDTTCIKNVCIPDSGKCESRPRSQVIKRKCPDDPSKGCINCADDDASCIWTALPPSDPPWIGYDKLKCDDGNSCTFAESCVGGQCLSTNWQCNCAKDTDCADDDNNLCTGTPYCDKAAGKCKVNPATVIFCTSANDTDCTKNVCDSKTGKCALKPVPGVNILCNDGDSCTATDTCENGQCVSGTNTCPCKTNSDCNAKEDGDVCNGTLYCDKTANPPACIVNPATVLNCPKGLDNQCRLNLCNPKTGACQLMPTQEGIGCTDGNPCTGGDICTAGQCSPTAFICDCTTNSDCTAKEDNDLCNGTLFCNLGKCQVNPATIVTCPVGASNPCVSIQCDGKTGKCGAKPVVTLFAQCDDGNPCTKNDECKAGICTSGANQCSCTSDSQCDALDDGNPCNGELFCDLSAETFSCKPKPTTAILCDGAGDSECQMNVCELATAKCTLKPMPWLCNDGNPCTLDSCTGLGVCSSVPGNEGFSCGVASKCKSGKCL